MPRTKIFLSIIIFSILWGITSVIKTQTRIIEKNIYKADRKLSIIEKDLYETQLDYFYLSTPKNLSKKIKELALIDYLPMDFSRIYLNFFEFNNDKNKITILNKANEKKIKKK